LQFKSDIPIYIQIATDIKEQIVSKKYIDGDKLPSVREYSLIYEVSALTIQRAIQQLEYEGVIQSKKGVGNFIADKCYDKVEKEMIQKQAKEFVASMRNMGLTDTKIENIIKEELESE
jgi:GntR family transcriptional regulator